MEMNNAKRIAESTFKDYKAVEAYKYKDLIVLNMILKNVKGEREIESLFVSVNNSGKCEPFYIQKVLGEFLKAAKKTKVEF